MNRQQTTFNVPDMKCQGCAERIEQVLIRQGGVRSADVSLADKTATVTYDADTADADTLQSAIETAGYTPELA